MGTKHLHPLGDSCIHGANANRRCCNVLPNGLAVIQDLPWYAKRLTSLLICCQSGKKPNAAPQPLPEAGATQERTLEAVGCRRLFGKGPRVILGCPRVPCPPIGFPSPPA